MIPLLEAPARALRSPVRNRYFWGKLLDAEHLELEQRYHNEKRWLLNRQAHGTGVLCGLAVELADDRKRLWLRPGVALDGGGREIVVPESFCLEHPDQLTDDLGAPVGDPVRDKTVWICLAYHECDIEPVRALVDCCDPCDGCRANAVRERFRVLVHEAPPPVPETVLDNLDPAKLHGQGPLLGPNVVVAGGGADGLQKTLLRLRHLLSQAWRSPCGPAALDCVPIAQVVVDGDGRVTQPPSDLRRQIPSNADLLDGLLLAAYLLVTRMNGLEARIAGQQRLRYQAGDSQSAKPGAALDMPISVLAEDANGNPLGNTDVSFHMMGGGGSVAGNGAATTGPDGVAGIAWTLGPEPGLNSVEALLGDARIAFHALAV